MPVLRRYSVIVEPKSAYRGVRGNAAPVIGAFGPGANATVVNVGRRFGPVTSASAPTTEIR